MLVLFLLLLLACPHLEFDSLLNSMLPLSHHLVLLVLLELPFHLVDGSDMLLVYLQLVVILALVFVGPLAHFFE